jgi:hypothetical protein
LYKKIILFTQLFFSLFLSSFPLQAGGNTTAPVDPQTTIALKQYMSKFGILMAGIEIQKIKEKQLDWALIDSTLTEMTKSLNEMQLADKNNIYKAYTELLSAQLTELKKQSQEKSKNIYEGFGKLSHTCFSCHAAHRPADFLTPKNKSIKDTQ